MRKLTRKQIAKLRKHLNFRDDGQVRALGEIPAEFHVALGEVIDHLQGFYWAWSLQGKFKPAPLKGDEGIAAQGIEGKGVVRCSLLEALVYASQVPNPYRYAIYAKRVPEVPGTKNAQKEVNSR